MCFLKFPVITTVQVVVGMLVKGFVIFKLLIQWCQYYTSHCHSYKDIKIMTFVSTETVNKLNCFCRLFHYKYSKFAKADYIVSFYCIDCQRKGSVFLNVCPCKKDVLKIVSIIRIYVSNDLVITNLANPRLICYLCGDIKYQHCHFVRIIVYIVLCFYC